MEFALTAPSHARADDFCKRELIRRSALLRYVWRSDSRANRVTGDPEAVAAVGEKLPRTCFALKQGRTLGVS
jgi:hypothetical protein